MDYLKPFRPIHRSHSSAIDLSHSSEGCRWFCQDLDSTWISILFQDSRHIFCNREAFFYAFTRPSRSGSCQTDMCGVSWDLEAEIDDFLVSIFLISSYSSTVMSITSIILYLSCIWFFSLYLLHVSLFTPRVISNHHSVSPDRWSAPPGNSRCRIFCARQRAPTSSSKSVPGFRWHLFKRAEWSRK